MATNGVLFYSVFSTQDQIATFISSSNEVYAMCSGTSQGLLYLLGLKCRKQEMAHNIISVVFFMLSAIVNPCYMEYVKQPKVLEVKRIESRSQTTYSQG